MNVIRLSFRWIDGLGRMLSPLPDCFAQRFPKIQFQVEPRLISRVPQRDGVDSLRQHSDEIVEARALDLKFSCHDRPFLPD
jgi:hypothetical protein